MNAPIDSSRMTTVEELLQASAVMRLEILAMQDEAARIQLADQLPAEAVLEILNLDPYQAVDHQLVSKEADKCFQAKIPSEDELSAFDSSAWKELLESLDNTRRKRVFRKIPMQIFADLMTMKRGEDLDYKVGMSHARAYDPTIEDLLEVAPTIRYEMLLIQALETQILLLSQLPARAKAEMLLQKFSDALYDNLLIELKSRETLPSIPTAE